MESFIIHMWLVLNLYPPDDFTKKHFFQDGLYPTECGFEFTLYLQGGTIKLLS